jgi:hypothetical protein
VNIPVVALDIQGFLFPIESNLGRWGLVRFGFCSSSLFPPLVETLSDFLVGETKNIGREAVLKAATCAILELCLVV